MGDNFEIELISESSFLTEGSSEDIKIKIMRIVGEIKRFFTELVKKISAYVAKARLEGIILKAERLEQYSPQFRNTKYQAYDISTQVTLYRGLMTSLNELNNMPVDEKYREKVNQVMKNYTTMVLSSQQKWMRLNEVLTGSYEILKDIQINGYKSYPEPSNEIIAVAYARAANYCGALVKSTIEQLEKIMRSSPIRQMFASANRIVGKGMNTVGTVAGFLT